MAYKKMKALAAALLIGLVSLSASAQERPPTSAVADYMIGPQDVLAITSYDQADLSGKFTVEADGTFTYPLIERVRAGGLTLRALETQLKKQLVDGGFFKNPQITVAVESYKSQKVFVVGEVRMPGPYTLSGNMTLVEVLSRAGSMLPTASGEAIIVHAGEKATGPTLPSDIDGNTVTKVNIRELEKGVFSQNAVLRDGDTIFVSKAESVYVFGEVKNAGAYALQHQKTTVLQALALAGGITPRGSQGRLKITRVVNGKERELKAKASDLVQAGDTITVGQRFF